MIVRLCFQAMQLHPLSRKSNNINGIYAKWTKVVSVLRIDMCNVDLVIFLPLNPKMFRLYLLQCDFPVLFRKLFIAFYVFDVDFLGSCATNLVDGVETIRICAFSRFDASLDSVCFISFPIFHLQTVTYDSSQFNLPLSSVKWLYGEKEKNREKEKQKQGESPVAPLILN